MIVCMNFERQHSDSGIPLRLAAQSWPRPHIYIYIYAYEQNYMYMRILWVRIEEHTILLIMITMRRTKHNNDEQEL